MGRGGWDRGGGTGKRRDREDGTRRRDREEGIGETEWGREDREGETVEGAASWPRESLE